MFVVKRDTCSQVSSSQETKRQDVDPHHSWNCSWPRLKEAPFCCLLVVLFRSKVSVLGKGTNEGLLLSSRSVFRGPKPGPPTKGRGWCVPRKSNTVNHPRSERSQKNKLRSWRMSLSPGWETDSSQYVHSTIRLLLALGLGISGAASLLPFNLLSDTILPLG